RLEVRCYVQHLVVVEVEPRDRVVRARPLGLLHEPNGPAALLELDHPVALRVPDVIAEYGRPLVPASGLPQNLAEAMTVEDVVAQDQGDRPEPDELPPDNKRLREPF